MQQLTLITPQNWSDFSLIDSGNGEKLEQYGQYVLRRPDPQILWQPTKPQADWQNADAEFRRIREDKGFWRGAPNMPEEWPVHWQDCTFLAKLSPFKHTGIFPEQAAHWGWFRPLIENRVAQAQEQGSEPPHILNLFAYTGGASIVAAKAGARVTHVDASRSSIGWAKKNQEASGLDADSIRWILDDVLAFVQREVKRGVRYDGIIMDPPVYGHGPKGERWDFKSSLPRLLQLVSEVLVEQPLFVVLNAYAVSTSAITLGNLLEETMSEKSGEVSIGELALQEESGRLLSTGIWSRWEKTHD